jgi:nicotinate-nucleotide adenylyltransferase
MVHLPYHVGGQRIGLYGGSFNPPHAGHRHVSLLALRRLKLDRLWWMVTPGNPLKDQSGLPTTDERVAAAEAVAHHPRIDVTAFECELGTRYTVDTLAFLVRRCPGVRFVWVMGADNHAGFHRWRGWERIAAMMPCAVVDRPGWTLRATSSRAASRLARYRITESEAPLLADSAPPAWVFLHGPRSSLSSTALRMGLHSLSGKGDVEFKPGLTPYSLSGVPEALSKRASS